jgi:hypothetical protein
MCCSSCGPNRSVADSAAAALQAAMKHRIGESSVSYCTHLW